MSLIQVPVIEKYFRQHNVNDVAKAQYLKTQIFQTKCGIVWIDYGLYEFYNEEIQIVEESI